MEKIQKKYSKARSLIGLGLLLLLIIMAACNGKKDEVITGRAGDPELFGSQPKNQGAVAPQTYGDSGATSQAAAVKVITDDNATTTSSSAPTEDPIIKGIMEGGYSYDDALKIKAIMPALKKEARGYAQITDRLMGKEYTSMFRGKNGAIEAYRVPLNALNYWKRFRGDRTQEAAVKEQMKVYSDWRIEHWDDERMLKKLDLVEAAWKLTPQYEIQDPN